MKKRNILKRNSGFIAGSILAAGVSFFAADTVLTELKPGDIPVESEQEKVITDTEKESIKKTTYETNPFTITANGAVVNQVEKEAEKNQSEQTANPETDENGNVIESTLENGEGNDGNSEGSGTISEGAGETSPENSGGENEGGSSDGTGSASGDNGNYGGSTSDGDNWSGSDYSGSSGDSYGDGSIVILDSSGGSYSYNGSSGGDTGGSSWEGSSGGSSSSGGDSGSGSGSSGGSYENGIYSPDDLILWHINSRYISEEELYNYDAATIRYIRNEIFALHGRIFLSEDLMAYFTQKSWYVPTYAPEVFDEDMESYLNDYELANLKVILAYEEALNG